MVRIFKYVFSIVIIFILFINSKAEESGYSLHILESNNNRLVCDIRFDSVIVIQKKTGPSWSSEISFPGCSYTDRENLPRVPVTSIVLGIPPYGEPRLTVLSENSVTRDLGEITAVKSVANDASPAEPYTERPLSLQVFPGNIVEKGVTGFFRDQRILQIELHPVRYFFDSGMTQIVRSLRLSVDFSGGGKSSAAKALSTVKTVNAETEFEPYYRSLVANYKESKMWRSVISENAPAPLNKIAETAPYRYKILVEQDGIYTVSGEELAKAGAELNTITIPTLTLYNKGRTVPIVVEGEADGSFDAKDRIIFTGKHNTGDSTYFSLFSETNVYWLTWGSGTGARYAEISGAPDAGAVDTLSYKPAVIHMEKDLLYDRLVSMPDESADHWLWQLMGEGQECRFSIPDQGLIQEGSFRVKAGMQGLTHPVVTPDHHVLIKFNEEIIGEATWDNQTPYIFDTGYIDFTANAPENILSLNIPGDLPGAEVDRIYLNWLEIEFRKRLQARNDTLTFIDQNPGKEFIRMSGFTSPEVYVFTNTGNRIIDVKQIRTPAGYDFIFMNHSFLPAAFTIAGKDKLKRVKNIIPAETSNLKNLNNGADYILITHPDFMEEAQRLVDFRTSRGLRSKLVDIQQVFDDFSYGIYDPRAIKRFLQYAYSKWQKPAPLYILLFGDITHKLDKQVARQEKLASFVPTMMEYTNTWGMSSSDNYFACVNGDDDLPDIFIGRLPVNTPEQAEIMVNKTIEHESETTAGEWRRNILMLTGVDEYFEESTRALVQDHVPERILANRVSTLDTSRYFGSTEDVAGFFNAGQTIVNFVGHGGGGVFSDAELFQIEDIQRLTNKQKYPMMFSLTCFIGHFDNPESPSLAEELLSAPDKGIVGSFGSSGRAFLQGDTYLNNAIFDVIFAQNRRSMGEISTMGKLEMIRKTRGFWDHVKSYNLLGDPALRIVLPEDNIRLQLSSNTLIENNQLFVTGSVAGFNDGSLIISAHNDFDSLIVSKDVSMQNGAFSVNLFSLNQQTRRSWGDKGGKGVVRAYFKNGNTEGASAVLFSVDKPYISGLYTQPEYPTHMVPFYFVVSVNRGDLTATIGQVDSLMIRWSEDGATWNYLGLREQTAGFWKTGITLQKPEGIDITYQVAALVNNQLVNVSEVKNLQIGYRPDLTIEQESIKVYGENQTFISAVIKNKGFTDSGPFEVSVYEAPDTSDVMKISPSLYVSGLGASSETDVAFIWPNSRPGEHDIIFRTDDKDQVDEQNELNNRTTKKLQVATITQGTAGEIYYENDPFSIKIPAGGINKNTSVELTREYDEIYKNTAVLADLIFIHPAGDTSWSAFQFSFADSSIIINKPVTVYAFFDKNDSLTTFYLDQNALKIFVWDTATNTWQGIESTINRQERFVSAELPVESRIFGLMASDDVVPPVIKIGIEGQHFAEGDIISPNPAFTIVAEDSSGFDTGMSPIRISLNDLDVDKELIRLFQADNTKGQVTATYSPELPAGEHRIKVEAQDINGNIGVGEVSFSVTGEFALTTIANHPNPFADETIIAFTLTDAADDVSLNIYTVSGRLIRSFEYFDIAGYMEQDWDGLDSYGNQVANGVYYLKFTAKKGDKKIERIEKMARLK
ncbi:hypothetical protein JXQ31_04710 [candidate division KSB1 bacterium]|nr:hypothetical protein [candidate division KSB1 bacterium]